MRQDFVDLITEDNVVYLQTFKLLKSGYKDYIAYKNKYGALPPDKRLVEKARVEYNLLMFPNSTVYKIFKKMIEEVENG